MYNRCTFEHGGQRCELTRFHMGVHNVGTEQCFDWAPRSSYAPTPGALPVPTWPVWDFAVDHTAAD